MDSKDNTKTNNIQIDSLKNEALLLINNTEIVNEANKLINNNKVVLDNKENVFPIDVFPNAIKHIIKETTESLNFPIDYFGVSILYASSLAIGNACKVEVKKSWQENAVLYIAIVGMSGINKSHPISFALQPIFDNDTITYKEYKTKKQEYERANTLTKKERDSLGNEEITKPIWQKHIVSDFTPEALVEVHEFNKRGIGVYTDELAGWFKNFNRYHKGNEQEFWLTNWSGKPIMIDRKTTEPIFIKQPFIPVIGTIQTKMLNEISKDNRNQNGFIDRILFSMPQEFKKPYWSDKEVSQLIIDNWKTIILKLINLPFSLDENLCPQSEILYFNEEAKEELNIWQRKNTDLANENENEQIKSIYAKLEVYVIRLSLILEMIYWSCNESNKQSIGLNAVKGAIKLIEYFKKTAININSILSDYNPLDKLPNNLQSLYEYLPNEFPTKLGVDAAKLNEISERNFKRFLTNRELFKCISRGIYEKIL